MSILITEDSWKGISTMNHIALKKIKKQQFLLIFFLMSEKISRMSLSKGFLGEFYLSDLFGIVQLIQEHWQLKPKSWVQMMIWIFFYSAGKNQISNVQLYKISSFKILIYSKICCIFFNVYISLILDILPSQLYSSSYKDLFT